jgi:O-antigen/teichoic acid export membrane protein
MAEQSLKDKTVKGVAWSGVDNVAQFSVSFVVSIVLARLLSPDDYGLLGIIAIFTAICSALIDGGFSNALIRKRNTSDEDYNTIFILNMLMSLLLYATVFFCSPAIASFFNREELIPLTRVSSLSLVIGALSMVQQTRLTKRIDFKTQTKITLIASITSGIVGITMALIGFGVWSLVAQSLSAQILRTILLWMNNHWVPKIHFSVVSFKELFGFGWKLMLSQLLNTLWQELYQVVVGKFYSPATLGQYTRAKGFAQLFSKNITSVIQRVTYPVLSNIQDDKERMVSAYRRIIKTTMFITAISMLFLGAISEPLLYCLIGPKWHDATTYLPLICISMSLYPLHAINLNMLQVQGRSDLFLGLEIIKKCIALGPLLIGAFVGIMPMLYSNLVITIISFFLNSYYSGKILNYSSWMQLKDVAPSYGVAFTVALSVFFLKYLPISNWVVLPIQMFTGMAVFLLVCSFTGLSEYNEVKSILKPILKRITHK